MYLAEFRSAAGGKYSALKIYENLSACGGDGTIPLLVAARWPDTHNRQQN